MTCSSEELPRHIIYLQSDRQPNIDSSRLENHLTACSITIAHSPGEAVACCDGTVDCLLADSAGAECAGVELLNELPSNQVTPPVILLADASDGTIPVSALREPFADVVPIDDTSGVATVADAIEAVIPDVTNPDIAGVNISDSQSLINWKANILDQFFTKIPLHMFVKDECAKHVLVSESYVERRIHGFGNTYLGRRDIDGVVPEEEAREPYEDDIRVIETGEQIRNKQEYYDESGRWFLTSKVPWENETGDIIGVLGISQEITEQKKRERQLKVINHLVRHNLRNKLTIIGGRAEYLHRETQCPDEQIETILSAVTDLSNQLDKQETIVNILAQSPEPTELNLSTLVSNEIDVLSQIYPQAQISTDIEEDLLACATDGIVHAISELVENAIIHNDSTCPTVEIIVETDQGSAQIHILDECAQIPTLEVEILTGQRDIDELSHSTGLGLWISRWVVDYSNGSISFEQGESGGNEVIVTVPTAEQVI